MPTGRRSSIERHLHLLYIVGWMLDQPERVSRLAAARELNRWLAEQAREKALKAGLPAEEAERLAIEAQVSEAVAAHQVKVAEVHARKASDLGMAVLLRRQVAIIEDRIEWNLCELVRVETELYGPGTIRVEQLDGSMAELALEPALHWKQRDVLRGRIDAIEERLQTWMEAARAVVGGIEWERREREIRAALKSAERVPDGEGRKAALLKAQFDFLELVTAQAVNPATTQLVAANRDRQAGAHARVKLVQAMPADGAGGKDAEPTPPARFIVEHRKVGAEGEPN